MATIRTITISGSGWTLAESKLYFIQGEGAVYYDSACTESAAVALSAVPSRECYAFAGLYSSTATSATQYTDEAGAFLSAFTSAVATWTTNKTIYVKGSVCAYKLTLNSSSNSGSGGTATLYRLIVDNSWRTTWDDSTPALTKLPSMPTRSGGYSCTGFFTAASSGTQWIDVDGTFLSAMTGSGITAAKTIYAQFAAWYGCTIKSDKNLGLSFVFYDFAGSGVYASRSSTTALSAITVPVYPGWTFGGIYTAANKSGTQLVNASGKILTANFSVITGTTTIYAAWTYGNGNLGLVTDWFGLESPSLLAISSTDGSMRERVCVSHLGKWESGINQISGKWLNPSVTYVVKGDQTLAVTLGKAFAATYSGTGTNKTMTVSGYMITSVVVETTVGQFPRVAVTGTANEGADAINTWTVSIPIEGRARAQNLLSAVSGGGQLQSLSLTATCDPVVVTEGMMPCASDIVCGRIEVAANLVAESLQDPPTAGTDFTAIAEPKSTSSESYVTYSFNARKEL